MYSVRWKRSALDQLTELWLDAENRAELNSAVDELDRLLGSSPHEVGESRTDVIRVAFCPPLGVFFYIDDANDVVEVLRVWTF
jgi:mRNA-degrading endonuclease RelE of RelBE toxin-antitoxin system